MIYHHALLQNYSQPCHHSLIVSSVSHHHYFMIVYREKKNIIIIKIITMKEEDHSSPRCNIDDPYSSYSLRLTHIFLNVAKLANIPNPGTLGKKRYSYLHTFRRPLRTSYNSRSPRPGSIVDPQESTMLGKMMDVSSCIGHSSEPMRDGWITPGSCCITSASCHSVIASLVGTF